MKRKLFSAMLMALCLLNTAAVWAQAKVDFWLRDAIKNYELAPSRGLQKVPSGIQLELSSLQPSVEVILQARTGDFSFVAKHGGILRTVAGPYATAQLPLAAIREIAGRDEVVYISPHPKLKPLNDVALSMTKADVAIASGYTGKNVIVGVIDTGIDVNHPAFRDSTGKSRILYLWDQTVQGTGTQAPYYDYGTEWTKAQIDANLCTSVDTDGHGTHVAGSLAGHMIGQNESIYHGGAIHANLIVVKGQIYLLDAINYIFEKARQLKKPAVINISLGSHFGPHDGTDPFTAALDYLTGPGRIIVQSAGNDGEHRIHHAVNADADGENMGFTLQKAAASLMFELWHNGASDVELRIIGPNGIPSVRIPAGAAGTLSSPNGNLTVDNASEGQEYYNGDKRISVKLDGRVAAGAWTFQLLSPTSTPVHAWMWDGDSEAGFAFNTTDNHYTLVNEACSRSSLVVGALASRTRIREAKGDSLYFENSIGHVGTVAKYSSGGPTRDGRQKPDVVAPAGMIISAKSSQVPASTQIFADEFRSIGGRYDIWGRPNEWAMTGTSQSAPQFANTVMMLVEVDPNQAPSQVMENVKKSTTPAPSSVGKNANRNFDSAVAPTWDYRAGYGLFTLDDFLKNAPRVIALKQTSGDVIEITFNKALTGANNAGNYAIVGASSGRTIISASPQGAVVSLRLSGNLIEGVRDSLRIANIEGFANPAVMEIDKLGTLVPPKFVLTNYVWHAEDSPYYVTDSLALPSDVTLTVEPGTVVKFLPGKNESPALFVIFGTLKAEGTPEAPIIFTSLNGPSPGEWGGLFFQQANSKSTLKHCKIEYANEAIVCLKDTLAIQNAVIAHSKDVGVFAQDADVTIQRTIIYDTKGGPNQDGIVLLQSRGKLENLTIHSNNGAGIFGQVSTATIRNCISANNGFGVYSNNSALDLAYSDVWSNGTDLVNVARGVGTISLNPLFKNAAAGDFNLLSTSPCIDTGDPASPLDPDNTRADMGALPFKHVTAVELTAFTAEVDNDNIALRWSTAGETNDWGFEIQRRGQSISFAKIGFVSGAGTTTSRHDYSFVDKALAPGRYFYRLKQIDPDGAFSFSSEVAATIGPPADFALHANFPNPFNPTTTIAFDLPKTAMVELQIFDLGGHPVKTLLHEQREVGSHRLVWDGTNVGGEKLASGVYLVRLHAGEFVKTIRTLLMK